MRINNLQNNIVNASNLHKEDTKTSKESSFTSIIKEKLEEVNEKQITAEKNVESFIKGDDIDIHEVMIATQEAKLSLELAVQVRNSLVDAYKEINRMQI